MGGKSSSSAATTNNQIDKRIAATDNAVVFQDIGGSVNVTDGGAIAMAGSIASQGLDFAAMSLDEVQEFAHSVLDFAKSAHNSSLDAIAQNNTTAFSFVDNQTRDENARAFSELAPILLVGVSVVAISYAWRK